MTQLAAVDADASAGEANALDGWRTRSRGTLTSYRHFLKTEITLTTDSTPSRHASQSVLLVDDDAFSQELISEMLQALGVTDIHRASTGRHALRTLDSLPSPPDFLICDIFMPDMDGIELLSELGKSGYAGGIVLISGLDMTMMAIARDVAIADGLKLLGALTKPIRQAVLAKTLGISGI